MRCSLSALPIFGVCLVIQPSNGGIIICGKNQYTIVNSTGTVQSCLPCETCHKGLGLHPKCGSTLQGRPTTIECRPCKTGTFSSEYDSSPCKSCHQCAEHEIKKAECTNKSDTVCSGKCEQGYFMSKTVHNCQECSACCLDQEDEKVQECAGLGTDKDCTPRPDKNCGSSNLGATESKKSLPTTIGVSVAGFVIAVGALLLMAYCCWRKRKRSLEQQPEAPSGEQRNGSANTRTSSHAYVSEGPRTEPRGVTFDSNCYNSSYHGTPQTSRQVIEVEEPKPVPVKDGIALVALPEEKQKSTNNKKPLIVSRQGSQDSQTSTGEFRKRSFSSRSIGEFVEKISLKRDNSLLESDEDSEAHEPIKIAKHPKSQTPKEGSKVELACKLEKKSKNFMYQWFKDDVAIIGQDKSVLELNPVQLRDFGCYMCRVSYKDLFGEAEKSNTARLDVIHHPGLNGMRLKRLTELDLGVMDRVALLLETRKHGCGDWRRIGSKYDMEDPGIAALANAPLNAGDRGKAVLDFVKATKPNLTVYDFCKTLKEDDFKRLDIVEELENHFLVSIKSDGQ